MEMNSSLEIIWSCEGDRWKRILDEVCCYDFYHLAEYHMLEHDHDKQDHKGVLFVYREQDRMIAWPFLLRDLTRIPGLEDVGIGYWDATSVYGYPGPLGTPWTQTDAGFLRRFSNALEPAFKDLGIVALFSRMNPILHNETLVGDFGSLERRGQTVYIDLRESSQDQWSQFHINCRYDIRKARKDGLLVVFNETIERIDEFADLYAATMAKVGGRKELVFGREYFHKLTNALGTRLHLFLAEKQGRVIAGSLFVQTGSIIQYHLSAKNPSIIDRSAARVIIDEARIFGNAVGAHFLHLGGGVGAQDDGVYQFKASFSSKRLDFYVWKHILMPGEYDLFVNARREWLSRHGFELPDTDFFPLYRVDPVPQETLLKRS